jgi:sugar lactone lactonase YvrE
LPQNISGANFPVSDDYGSQSEGTIQLSGNGLYLTMMGYGLNAATFNVNFLNYCPGSTEASLPIVTTALTPCLPENGNPAMAQTGTLLGQTYSGNTPVPRVAVLIDANGKVNSSTVLYGIYNQNDARSAYSPDGISIYVSGQGCKTWDAGDYLCDNSNTLYDDTQGVYLTTLGANNYLGANNPIAITGPDNGPEPCSNLTTCTESQSTRMVQIYNNTLYVSMDDKGGNNRSFIGTLGDPAATSLFECNGGSNGGPCGTGYGPYGPAEISGLVNTGGTGKYTLNTAGSGNTSNGNNLNAGLAVNLSPQNYFFASSNVLYVADTGSPKNHSNGPDTVCTTDGTTDSATVGNGGLQKWILNPTVTAAVTNSGSTSAKETVTASSGAFTQGEVGLTITDSMGYIPAGTTITAVSSAGANATMSAAATGVDATDIITVHGWSLVYTLYNGLNLVLNADCDPNSPTTPLSLATTGLYGVTGTVSSGVATLWVTTYPNNDLVQTYLYGITDTLATEKMTSPGTAFTLLDTAPAGSILRGVSFVPTVSAGDVEVTTVPSGLTVTSANTGCAPSTFTTPLMLAWTPGSTCTLSVTTPQTPAYTPGTQYVFSQWQDGTTGTTDTVTAPSSTATNTYTYTATFTTQYQLTTSATTGGTVSTGGFYTSGTNAIITATPSAGYYFVNFTGTIPSSTTNPLTVDMTAPESVTANFAAQISQAITFTTPAPANAAYGSQFTVAATGGASGNPVTFTSAGACSNVLGTYTMTSGTGTCSVIANQAGSSNGQYSAAPPVTESVAATMDSGSGYISVTAASVASSIYPSQGDTLSATVTVTGAGGAPAGTGETVSFYAGATLLGTGTLSTAGSNDSSTSITVIGSQLTLGGNSITAVYSGDANYSTTTSAAITVTLLSPVVSFGSSNVGTAATGQTLNYTFTSATTLTAVNILTLGASGLDYNDGGNSTCIATAYTAGQSCVVTVALTPTAPGARAGAVTLFAQGSDLPLMTWYLSGVGNSGAVTIDPGTLTTITLTGTLAPAGYGSAVDGAGNVYVVDHANNAVLKLAAGTFSQSTVVSGLSDPTGVALDGAGDLYISNGSSVVMVPNENGMLNAGNQSTVNLSGLGSARGVAVDSSGDLYVADATNGDVVELSSLGVQTTIASGLTSPHGVAVDAALNVYVATDNAVTQYPLGGGAAVPYGTGYNNPRGVAVDAAGAVYVADTGNNQVVRVSPGGGSQTTLTVTGVSSPQGVSVDASDNLYVTDPSIVIQVNRTQAAQLNFPRTNVGSTSATQVVTVTDAGNQALQVSNLAISADFASEPSGGTDCTSSTDLGAGGQCEIGVAFKPTVSGALTGTVSLSDNALNNAGSTQTVALSGTGSQVAQTITFSINAPASAVYASQFTVAATASSGLQVTFTSAGVCSNVGATYTMTNGTGTCSVIANQAGNTEYSAAPQVTQTASATPASQTITFTTNAPASASGGSQFTVAAAASSGLAVAFTSSGACSNSGATYTMTSGTGTCSVIANQAGNSQYSPAPQVTQTTNATLAGQTITFGALTNQPLGTAPFAVSATASSGLTVSFASLTTPVCTVSGTTVTLVTTGVCTIQATQTGNTIYAAAAPVNQSFEVTFQGLGASSLLFGSGGGSSSVVLAYSGAWTATSNASFLQISAGSASGTGNSVVAFTIDPFAGTGTRTGTLTIAGSTLTVTQAGTNYIGPSPVTTLVSGLNSPIGMAVDGSGNVYFSDSVLNVVEEWNAATQQVTTLVSGLSNPSGVAVDGSGNVYFADSGNNAIKEWNTSTQQVTTLVSGLNNPSGVTVDRPGNVYFADSGNQAIKEWNAATQAVAALVSSGLSNPSGVAVDGDGNVYFSDSVLNVVDEWNVATQTVSTLVSGLNGPTGTAVDGSGNVYFSDSGNNAIKEWIASTQQVNTLVSVGLNGPSGVAVDGLGDVYFADTGNKAIQEILNAFVGPASGLTEQPAAGSGALLPVLPATASLTGIFAPTSNQSWLTIGTITGGVVNFSFTANRTTSTRAAIITVLGQSITVTQNTLDQAPAITSGTSTTFNTGTAGSFTVTATGYPAPRFSETGALPTGVTFAAATGVLSGTPRASTGGSYPLTFTATNAVGTSPAQSFTLTVDQAPAVTSTNRATFTVGTAGTFTVTGTGYPAPTFSETGALPSGVTLSAAGVLSGTPAAGTGGVYHISVTASNAAGTSAAQNFTLTVDQAPAITSGASTTFTAGTAGSFTVTAAGYPTPTFTRTGTLPSGVMFAAATGVLSGTPGASTGGSYPLTFTATNSVGTSAAQSFTLTVDQVPAVTSTNRATFIVGRAGTFTVTGTGYPAPTFSETGALPSGVTLSAAGVLSGTPAAGTGGVYTISVTARNAAGTSAAQNFTLTVGQAPAITSGASTTFTIGTAGSFTVTATGYPAPTLTKTGTLPSGVTFAPATGVLSGTPAAGTAGTYTLHFTASNGVGANATQVFTLTVN